MARKPAQTKAEDKARDATVATGAAKPADTGTDQAAPETGATENTNDSGTDTAGDAADAREDVPAAEAPGQTGGEDGSDLPAGQPAVEQPAGNGPLELVGQYEGSARPITIKSYDRLLADDEAGSSLAAAVAAMKDEAQPIRPEGTDISFLTPAWIVTCHREGGRRRADRRWPKGETRVEAGELTAYDLAILKGDPQFSVRPADQD